MHQVALIVLTFAMTLFGWMGAAIEGAEMNDGATKSAISKRVRHATSKPTDNSEYRIARMQGNSTIDADWNKPAWRAITPLTLDYYMGDEPTHQPVVQAKAAYDDSFLYIIWRVEDNFVLAKRTQNQQDIWRDSCAEFFFTPVGDHTVMGYFNLETNCIGKKLFHAHVVAGKNEKLAMDDVERVTTASSLVEPINPERATPTTWTLEYRIPFDLIAKYTTIDHPAAGVKWRGNFYKCGDESSHPHWLTWAPIENEKPSFHVPKHFGTLIFE